jgi:hypothetical protein
MTMDAIAEAITPTGYVAAIVGVVLSIFVLMIRFRASNIHRKANEDAVSKAGGGAQQPDPNQEPVSFAPPQAQSTFKKFAPEKGATAEPEKAGETET